MSKQPAPAQHLARLEGWSSLRIVLATALRVSRFCDPDTGGVKVSLSPGVLLPGSCVSREARRLLRIPQAEQRENRRHPEPRSPIPEPIYAT